MKLAGRTCLIVDSHPLWLDAVELVAARVGVEVLGKTTSATTALSLLEEHAPDLLLTDVSLPRGEIDGLALLRRARERVPNLRIIVLSTSAEREQIDAAFAAGSDAYVLKTAHPEDLAAAMRQAFEPSMFIGGSRPAAMRGQRSPELTRREREIVVLAAEGRSNGEIARLLWLSEKTVKFHLSNVYRKLGLSNRVEASRWVQGHGLMPGAKPDQRSAA